MTKTTLDEDLAELSAAEEFLEYFEVPYDLGVVQVSRLHILQRFHDYIAHVPNGLPEAEPARREAYRRLLTRAYQDFVTSDALTEKVFRVFHMNEPETTFVLLDSLIHR